MAEKYLSMTEYNALVATLLTVPELLSVEPSVWTGTVTEDEIKIALGERCDIWPECIREIENQTSV
jgi:hypothetical protein